MSNVSREVNRRTGDGYELPDNERFDDMSFEKILSTPTRFTYCNKFFLLIEVAVPPFLLYFMFEKCLFSRRSD